MQVGDDTYTVWIEAEELVPGTWALDNAATDVIVTREVGDHWLASFITYQYVKTIVEKDKKTGENLSGAYFWTDNMILVDEISRSRIEEVIRELSDKQNFEYVFRFIDNYGE